MNPCVTAKLTFMKLNDIKMVKSNDQHVMKPKHTNRNNYYLWGCSVLGHDEPFNELSHQIRLQEDSKKVKHMKMKLKPEYSLSHFVDFRVAPPILLYLSSCPSIILMADNAVLLLEDVNQSSDSSS